MWKERQRRGCALCLQSRTEDHSRKPGDGMRRTVPRGPTEKAVGTLTLDSRFQSWERMDLCWFFFFFFNVIRVSSFYNVVLVSNVQQSESATCIHVSALFCGFHFHLDHRRTLSEHLLFLNQSFWSFVLIALGINMSNYTMALT